MEDLLSRLDAYLDLAPRANADVEEVGPFTLFVSRAGWPYYARPRLGLLDTVSADDVRRVLDRQQTLGVRRSLEWVHETVPTLVGAARAAGLALHECPLLVLDDLAAPDPPHGTTVRMLASDDPEVDEVRAAVARGFGSSGDVGTGDVARDLMARDLLRMCGAFTTGSAGDGPVAVAGGSHVPRGDVTEIAGVAVLPEHRRRGIGGAVTAALVHDALGAGIRTVFCSAGTEQADRVYRALGFEQVGTAIIAEPAPR